MPHRVEVLALGVSNGGPKAGITHTACKPGPGRLDRGKDALTGCRYCECRWRYPKNGTSTCKAWACAMMGIHSRNNRLSTNCRAGPVLSPEHKGLMGSPRSGQAHGQLRGNHTAPWQCYPQKWVRVPRERILLSLSLRLRSKETIPVSRELWKCGGLCASPGRMCSGDSLAGAAGGSVEFEVCGFGLERNGMLLLRNCQCLWKDHHAVWRRVGGRLHEVQRQQF